MVTGAESNISGQQFLPSHMQRRLIPSCLFLSRCNWPSLSLKSFSVGNIDAMIGPDNADSVA